MRQFTLGLLILLVLGYAGLLVYDPHPAPINDYFLIPYLDRGELLPIDRFIRPDSNRFLPLHGQEYNIPGWLGWTSMRAIGFVNALQLLGVFSLFYWLLGFFGIFGNIRNLALIALLFTPGVNSSFQMAFTSEKPGTLWVLLMMFFYFRGSIAGSWPATIACWVSALIASFYKEPYFAFAVALGLHSVFTGYRSRVLGGGLIACAIGFLASYFFLSFLPGHATGSAQVIPFIQKITTWIGTLVRLLLHEPFLVIGLFYWAVREYRVWLFKDQWTIRHTLLLGALAIFGIHFLRNLHNPWYLFPAYAFALPVLLIWTKENWKDWQVRAAVAGAAFLYLTSALPYGLHLASTHQWGNKNFEEAREWVANYLIQQPQGRVVLDALPKMNEIAVSWDAYLKHHHGVIYADVLTTEQVPIEQLGPQDLLIVTPESLRGMDWGRIERLKAAGFNLELYVEAPWSIPNATIKTAARMLLPGASTQNQNRWWWPEYWIWRRGSAQ